MIVSSPCFALIGLVTGTKASIFSPIFNTFLVILKDFASFQSLLQEPLLLDVASLEYSTTAPLLTSIGPVNFVIKSEFPFSLLISSKITGETT